MDVVSTKMTNIIATNARKNFHSKKVRDCFILDTVLLAIILLLIIAIVYYHYANHRWKQKGIDALTI